LAIGKTWHFCVILVFEPTEGTKPFNGFDSKAENKQQIENGTFGKQKSAFARFCTHGNVCVLARLWP